MMNRNPNSMKICSIISQMYVDAGLQRFSGQNAKRLPTPLLQQGYLQKHTMLVSMIGKGQ